MQAGLVFAGVGAGALVLTVTSVFADRRRLRRSNMDDVGFMPWTLITVIGTIATLFAFALAVRFT